MIATNIENDKGNGKGKFKARTCVQHSHRTTVLNEGEEQAGTMESQQRETPEHRFA
ncbi:MAG: hypothetical protein NTU47_07805 [Ignavibacteriales bacterium]|nr:hypothetical protein [Ignavibacteriales bacterium]